MEEILSLDLQMQHKVHLYLQQICKYYFRMSKRSTSPSLFLQLGTDLKRKKVSSSKTNHRRFKAWYGIDWKLMSVVWDLLHSSGWIKKNIKKRRPNPIHLLWALSFLKAYNTEDEHAADVGKEAKTFRKWAWMYCEGIGSLVSRVVSDFYSFQLSFMQNSNILCAPNLLIIIILRKIKLDKRFLGDRCNQCLLTVDGTDYRIQEPWPFVKEENQKWFSHKFKAAAVRYEIGIGIRTGHICWFHGPFPAGMPDISIFRIKLKQKLGCREKVLADFGYKGDAKVSLPNDDTIGHDNCVGASQLRGRHETINGKLKRWGVLRQLFRHNRNKHHVVFKACITLTQLLIDYGERSFKVENYDAKGLIDV